MKAKPDEKDEVKKGIGKEERGERGYVFIKGQSVTKGTPVPRTRTHN
jgi:hypothetical protein